MASTATRARVMGTTIAKMPIAAYSTRTCRISSVAYAEDERLSLAKTARAVGLPRRSWARGSGVGGVPTTRRLKALNLVGTGGRRGPSPPGDDAEGGVPPSAVTLM